MVSKQLLQCLDISNVNIPFWSIVIAGEQGWHNGESTRLMTRVQIPASTPLVVSSLLREISLRILRLSPLLKPTFQISILSGTHGHVQTSSQELLSASRVNRVQFTVYNLFL